MTAAIVDKNVGLIGTPPQAPGCNAFSARMNI